MRLLVACEVLHELSHFRDEVANGVYGEPVLLYRESTALSKLRDTRLFGLMEPLDFSVGLPDLGLKYRRGGSVLQDGFHGQDHRGRRLGVVKELVRCSDGKGVPRSACAFRDVREQDVDLVEQVALWARLNQGLLSVSQLELKSFLTVNPLTDIVRIRRSNCLHVGGVSHFEHPLVGDLSGSLRDDKQGEGNVEHGERFPGSCRTSEGGSCFALREESVGVT